MAQLEALKAEKASKLLEELTALDTICPEMITDAMREAIAAADLVRYALTREKGYLVEESVNEHCSINVGTLYKLMTDRKINVAYGSSAGRLLLMTRKNRRSQQLQKQVTQFMHPSKMKKDKNKHTQKEETKVGMATIKPATANYSQPTRDEMITAWDKCLLAKFKPGTINTPVVAGMNVAPFPTLIARTSGTEA